METVSLQASYTGEKCESHLFSCNICSIAFDSNSLKANQNATARRQSQKYFKTARHYTSINSYYCLARSLQGCWLRQQLETTIIDQNQKILNS